MPPCQSRSEDEERALGALHERLAARRESISRELHEIPPPVPACDVNFNRLLEDRARIVDALQKLELMRSSGEPLETIVASCAVGELLAGSMRDERI